MPKKTKTEDTIFEGENVKVEEEEPTPTTCDIPPVPAEELKGDKLTKKKRVLTQETKDRLKEQLKKGRETALANRQRKAQVKKIDNEEKVNMQEKKIIENAVKNQKIKAVDNTAELEALRKELAELKQTKNNPPPSVPEPKPEKVKAPKKPKAVAVKKENHTIKAENKVVEKPAQTPAAAPPKPAPTPAKPAAPLMTNREMMRRMKGIF